MTGAAERPSTTGRARLRRALELKSGPVFPTQRTRRFTPRAQRSASACLGESLGVLCVKQETEGNAGQVPHSLSPIFHLLFCLLLSAYSKWSAVDSSSGLHEPERQSPAWHEVHRSERAALEAGPPGLLF